jgi:nucleotide-binding universal stress UspA family protein
MRILIGYDGSDCADAALDDLTRAGLPEKAEAIVMSVVEVWLPPPPPSAYELIEGVRNVQVPDEAMYTKAKAKAEASLAHAQQARRRLQTHFPGWQVTTASAAGSPAWEIIAWADQWKPDLIVVGSHGRSALGRLVLGSVAQRVVTEARCSVRVARGRVEEPGTPVRVIAGLDGSTGSEAAVREIARRSWPAGSEVRLIVANDLLTPTLAGEFIPGLSQALDESNGEDRTWIEKLLEDAAHILKPSGLGVSVKIWDGDPKRVLVEAAEKWGADCIFVGSTGVSNRFERFVLGSVSASVVARAHCSVEVVR